MIINPRRRKSIKGSDRSVYDIFLNAQHILLSNNWGMWWIGAAAADGNDDDKIIDNGWKCEFDDIFIVDCIAFEK